MSERDPHLDSLARSVEYHKRRLAEKQARRGAAKRRLIPVWLHAPVSKPEDKANGSRTGTILIVIGWVAVIAISLAVGISQYVRSDGDLFRAIVLGAVAFLGAYAFAWWLWAIGYFLAGRIDRG